MKWICVIFEDIQAFFLWFCLQFSIGKTHISQFLKRPWINLFIFNGEYLVLGSIWQKTKWYSLDISKVQHFLPEKCDGSRLSELGTNFWFVYINLPAKKDIKRIFWKKKIKVMAFFRQFRLICTFKRNHCFSRHQNKARNSKGKCNIVQDNLVLDA